jgi:hypothetical protein
MNVASPTLASPLLSFLPWQTVSVKRRKRYKPEFPFDLENGTIVCTRISPVRDIVKRFSSGALPTVCHSHQQLPELPDLAASFCNTFLAQAPGKADSDADSTCSSPIRCARHEKDFFLLGASSSVWDYRLIRRPVKDARRKREPCLGRVTRKGVWSSENGS